MKAAAGLPPTSSAGPSRRSWRHLRPDRGHEPGRGSGAGAAVRGEQDRICVCRARGRPSLRGAWRGHRAPRLSWTSWGAGSSSSRQARTAQGGGHPDRGDRRDGSRPPPPGVACLFIGEDSGDGAKASHGGERRRLEQLAVDAGIGDRVRFLGAVPTTSSPATTRSPTSAWCRRGSRPSARGPGGAGAGHAGGRVAGGWPPRGGGRRGDRPSGRRPRAARLLHRHLPDPPRRRRPGADGGGGPPSRRTFSWERMVDRLLSIYGRVSSREIPAELPCGYEMSLGRRWGWADLRHRLSGGGQADAELVLSDATRRGRRRGPSSPAPCRPCPR